jgi:hypothetical protein
MKGSINRGGEQNMSESILRALSSAPRCALIGAQDIIYNLDVIYNLATGVGGIAIQGNNNVPQASDGFFNPPKPYPYNKWLLDVTYTVISPVPGDFKFGMAQIVNYNGGHDDSRFLVDPGAWSKVFFNGDGPPKATAHFYQSWVIPGIVNSNNPTGPDLFSFLPVDLSVIGTKTQRIILPEQKEFCDTYFAPFVFSNGLTNINDFGINLWKNLVNLNDQIAAGPGVFYGGVGPNLYPIGTKIGTLQFRFRRISNRPLFKFSGTPPRNFTFTNLSFYNPSLEPTWDWDFGDNSAHSASRNATHSYATVGKYHVVLKATDPSGTQTFDQFVDLQFAVDFTLTGTLFPTHIPPVFSVGCTDKSTGNVVAWHWDFGDGTFASTQNALKNYVPGSGDHTITLTVTDPLGNTLSKSKIITA